MNKKSNNNLTAIFTDTANAIRTKTGSSDLICPLDFADQIENIPAGEDTAPEIIARTVTTISNPNVTAVASFAFYMNTTIQNVSFPNCSIVNQSAFGYCSNLRQANLVNCKKISDYAFLSCSRFLFGQFDSVISIGVAAFSSCNNLIVSNGFPECEFIGSYAFMYNSNMSLASFPKCTSLYTNAFYSCSRISEAYLPVISNLPNNTFASCNSLMKVYILNGSVISLGNQNAFTSTPMTHITYTGAYGSIYVHPDMVSTYQSATNWAALSSRITAAPQEMIDKGIWPYEYRNNAEITEIPSEKSNAETICYGAFADCSNLITVRHNTCKSILSWAFRGCYNIETIDLPACEYIDFTFSSCSRLTSLYLPVCKSIRYAFHSCDNLVNVNLPKCEFIGGFMSCPLLSSVYAPECITLTAFSSCNSLSYIDLPKCENLSGYALANCPNLNTVKLSICNYIGNYALRSCTGLKSLYLLSSELVRAGGDYTLQNSPYCTMYVPAALLSLYKKAPIWSTKTIVGLTDEEIANL